MRLIDVFEIVPLKYLHHVVAKTHARTQTPNKQKVKLLCNLLGGGRPKIATFQLTFCDADGSDTRVSKTALSCAVAALSFCARPCDAHDIALVR